MDYSSYKKLEFRRKFLRVFGASIDVIDPQANQKVGFIEMKAWKLREDVRLYSDSSKQQEVLRIHARSIVDFGATYDVYAGGTENLLFSLRRKGLKSTFVRDHWEISDSNGAALGKVQEISSGLALLRRYVGWVPVVGWALDLAFFVVPLTYTISDNTGAVAAKLVHRKNPIIVKLGLDTSDATTQLLGPEITIAAAAMLSVIDASKN